MGMRISLGFGARGWGSLNISNSVLVLALSGFGVLLGMRWILKGVEFLKQMGPVCCSCNTDLLLTTCRLAPDI